MMEKSELYDAMSINDSQSTRAKIAEKAMNVLIAITLIFVLSASWVYVSSGAENAFSIEMGGVFLTITATFTYVIRSYFGDIKTEAKSRHRVIDDKPPEITVSAAVASKLAS
ncbi:MAG: hypothetical protein L3J21_09735 [Devosiaceae bacterium]|nr:hypothetical protein [Devosiaceae bacterium]